MTIVRVGTSKKYADGWEQAFSDQPATKKRAASSSTTKPAPAKKTAKKKAAPKKKPAKS